MAEIERVLWIVLGGLIAAIAGFFSSYFKEKGKNYATKEDFDDLRIQQQELTRATKQVEARISNEVWDRKRGWELKRDALLEAARCVADVDAMLVRVDAVMKVKAQQPEASDRVKSFLIEKQNESMQALNDADNELSRAHMIVSIVGSPKVSGAFDSIRGILRDVSQRVLTDSAVDEYSANRQRIQKSVVALVIAIQAELTAPASHSS